MQRKQYVAQATLRRGNYSPLAILRAAKRRPRIQRPISATVPYGSAQNDVRKRYPARKEHEQLPAGFVSALLAPQPAGRSPIGPTSAGCCLAWRVPLGRYRKQNPDKGAQR